MLVPRNIQAGSNPGNSGGGGGLVSEGPYAASRAPMGPGQRPGG